MRCNKHLLIIQYSKTNCSGEDFLKGVGRKDSVNKINMIRKHYLQNIL